MTNKAGRTALMLAILYSKNETCLLDHGADVNVKDNDDQ